MQRGRPTQSQIRQNIIEILHFLKKAYGYAIYKHYCELFPKPTLRVMYYHLKKGVALGELEVDEIKLENADYSWGQSAEKIYYRLGPKANPRIDSKVKKYFDRIKNK